MSAAFSEREGVNARERGRSGGIEYKKGLDGGNYGGRLRRVPGVGDGTVHDVGVPLDIGAGVEREMWIFGRDHIVWYEG